MVDKKIINEQQYSDILDIILAFNREVRHSKLLDVLLTKMMGLTNSDAGTLYLSRDDKLHFRIVKNMSLGIDKSMDDIGEWPPVSLDASNIDNISAYVALKREVVVIDDVYADTRFNFSGPKNYDTLTGYRTRSMLVLPLVSHGKNGPEVIGVIQLVNAKNRDTGAISLHTINADVSVLTAIANIAAGILSNSLYAQETTLLFDSLIDVTTQAIDERSAYSRDHTQNVSKYCRAFAEYLNNCFKPGDKYYFSINDVEELALAALLHDIGKIITPLEIMDKSDRLGLRMNDICYRFTIKMYQLEISYLKGDITYEMFVGEKTYVEESLSLIEYINDANLLEDEHIEKICEMSYMTYHTLDGETVPLLSAEDLDSLYIRYGTLTAKERKIMENHVVITGRLLDRITFPDRYKRAPIWARNHHEFLDGTGYPEKLKGDEIDIGSRILTIVDIFEALISNDRPYKIGISIDKSLEVLAKMANDGQLDIELVQLFCESKVWEVFKF